MAAARGRLDLGADDRVWVHHRNGRLRWFVEAVLCGREAASRGGEACWRMRVFGPLPGDPGRNDWFVMVARGGVRGPGG